MPCTSDAPRAENGIRALKRQGYCIMEDLVPATLVERLAADLAPDFARTPAAEGPFYGRDTIRFGGLLARSPHTAAFVQQSKSQA